MLGHCIIASPSNCFCQGCNRLLGIFEAVPMFKLLPAMAAAQARYIDVATGHVYKGCKDSILAIVNILPNLVSNQPASGIITIAISLDKFNEFLSHVISTWN